MDREHVIVVGYDAWTQPVLDELASTDYSVSALVTEAAPVHRLEEGPARTVVVDEFDESAFREAGIDRASAVLVATLDDQLNVLAVLTVMSVDSDIDVLTFAGEARDVPKLEAAGADTVISLGRVVGELLVDVAVDGHDVDVVVTELIEELS